MTRWLATGLRAGCAGIAILWVGASPGAAAPLTLHFEGSVSQIDDRTPEATLAGLSIGDPIHVELTFDEATADTEPDADEGRFLSSGAPSGIRATVGGLAFVSEAAVSLVISDGSPPPSPLIHPVDLFIASAALDMPEIDLGDSAGFLRIQTASGADVLPDDSLPTASVLAGFQDFFFSYDDTRFDDVGFEPTLVEGTVHLVPEPGVAILLAAGLLGLGLLRATR